jgi:hypothetical protein
MAAMFSYVQGVGTFLQELLKAVESSLYVLAMT